jgi:hypothetical protein
LQLPIKAAYKNKFLILKTAKLSKLLIKNKDIFPRLVRLGGLLE